MVYALRVLSVICLLCVVVMAQKVDNGREIVRPASYKEPNIVADQALDELLRLTVDATINIFAGKGVKRGDVAATLIDVSDMNRLKMASVRGDAAIYPASVVKMFYMAALERQLEDKKVTMTPELARGLKDMIVDSSNEATQYIFDVITGTASGSELPKKEFDAWQFKRNRVNRWLTSMGYTGINVNQKTFCEDAYGIEQQSRGYKGKNRNMITTYATARLMAEIVLGRIADAGGTAKMMELMKRYPFAISTDADSQAVGFTGKAFIDLKLTDARLWSKAGWTSKTRHDAAYIELPDGAKFVLVIFTENHANEREIIPSIARVVIAGMRK